MISQILQYDERLLISLQGIIAPEYATLLKLTSESIVIWCMIFLVATWLYGTIHKNNAYKVRSLHICAMILSVFLIYSIVYFFLPQWRPHPGEILSHTIQPLIPHPLDNSFPSGHALFSSAFVVAMFVYTRQPVLIAITIVFALLTLCSRVLGGVHYPGDILGGIFFGMLGALLLRPVSEWVVKQSSPFLLKVAAFFRL